MDIQTNADWIQRFEAYLQRRFPERSTAKHDTSDLRIFETFHAGPLTEVTTKMWTASWTTSTPCV